jgi:hypothetical protein
VLALADQVRETIQSNLNRMVATRTSVFRT